jgi:type IV pilus assembly protein PilO
MALLLRSQRDQLTFLAGFVVVAMAAAYLLFPYSHGEDALVEEAEQIATLESTNAASAHELATLALPELRARAAADRATLEVMRRLVPKSNEVPALLEEVSTAARRAGLDLGGVTPEPVIVGEQYDTYRYTVTITGSYHEVGAFLANVGSLARIVAPVHFALNVASTTRTGSSKDSERTALTSTILLQTYVERPGAAASPGGAP